MKEAPPVPLLPQRGVRNLSPVCRCIGSSDDTAFGGINHVNFSFRSHCGSENIKFRRDRGQGYIATVGINEDTLLVATDIPPLRFMHGSPESVTYSNLIAISSATSQLPMVAVARYRLPNSKLSYDSNAVSAEYSKRLSRGAVVAVGVEVSRAGAGLVAMTVFIIMRRHVYKKQKKMWQEQFRVFQTPKMISLQKWGVIQTPRDHREEERARARR